MAPTLDDRRHVPSVDQMLRRPRIQEAEAHHGRALVLRCVRLALESARLAAGAGGPAAPDSDQLEAAILARVETAAAPSLRRVINATGVVIHTNLGRAPLPAAAAQRVAELAAGYSNLEFDLGRGERGDRELHAERRLRELLGVEAAVVVNNNAAAVLLAVNTLAEGREAIVSRGELVEIGGSFRVPEVLRKGGAVLREVGTTNRTRVSDYRAALGPATGVILKVHPSNFRIVGFTEAPPLAELAALARGAGVPLVEDLGCGLLSSDGHPLTNQPSVEESLRAGVDVVTFSGDKLLGGPQAGLIVGRKALIDPMRRNPLYRALRVDKLTIAALDAVLALHEAGRGVSEVPVLRAVATTAAELLERAHSFAAQLQAAGTGLRVAVLPGHSAVGGGSAPGVELPTSLVAVTRSGVSAERLAAALRAGDPPVVARVADDRLVVDLRTVAAEDEGLLVAAIERAAKAGSTASSPDSTPA